MKKIAIAILEKYEEGLYKSWKVLKTKKINSELVAVLIKGKTEEGWIVIGVTSSDEENIGYHWGVYEDVPMTNEELEEYING